MVIRVRQNKSAVPERFRTMAQRARKRFTMRPSMHGENELYEASDQQQEPPPAYQPHVRAKFSRSSPLNLHPRANAVRSRHFYLRQRGGVWLGGVAVGYRTCDQIGRGFESQPLRCRMQPGQVVGNTHMPMSPSSIIWYQPMGGGALRLGR